MRSRVSRSWSSVSSDNGPNLHAISVQLHAAPVSAVILRRIVKIENAGAVATLFYER
jgi:hypothetical protein